MTVENFEPGLRFVLEIHNESGTNHFPINKIGKDYFLSNKIGRGEDSAQ